MGLDQLLAGCGRVSVDLGSSHPWLLGACSLYYVGEVMVVGGGQKDRKGACRRSWYI